MSLILFLHGASSSGKSTLAAAIRAAADRPFVHLSLDHLRDSGAVRVDDYADWAAARPAVFDGLHRSFAAFAEAGNDLIIEHILDTPGFAVTLRRLLQGHQVLFVGVITPLAVLQRREAARGDRPLGSAARDFDHVHAGLRYDLILDGTQDPAHNAARVLSALSHPHGAFFDP